MGERRCGSPGRDTSSARFLSRTASSRTPPRTSTGCLRRPDRHPRERRQDLLAWRADEGWPLIYCVVPAALADELYDKLTAYYADDSNVTVIVDRRKGERRTRGDSGGGGGKRELRDRRQRSYVDRQPQPIADA